MDGTAGVDPTLVEAYRYAARLVSETWPGIRLVVTSGFRSPTYQASLRDRWASGDRRGLTSEPAQNSKHSAGRAVDLGFIAGGVPVPVKSVPRWVYAELAEVMAPYGVKWGGRFRSPSPNHFEI